MSDTGDKWEGYSVFKEISSQLHEDVNRAIKAYAHINSLDSQNVGITPQTAVKTKSAILGVSKRIFYEVQVNQHIDDFDEIYARWAGKEMTDSGFDEAEEDGHIERLEDADFTSGAPPFLPQLMDDLVTATWKLGYIRAGVKKSADPEDTEEQVEEMFE